jgi:hypothetical protein
VIAVGVVAAVPVVGFAMEATSSTDTKALIGAHQSSAQVRGPFRLVDLPALGAVSWSCRNGQAFRLTYTPTPGESTTKVEFLTGGRLTKTATDVTDRTVSGAFSATRKQEVRLTQFTGAGTLSASVMADFGATGVAPPCYRYLPPKTTIQYGPRR